VPADAQDRIVTQLASGLALNDSAFTPRERALVAYADKLTLAPATVRRADVVALVAHGFDDRAVHDACAIVAYFAFVNRIADGLGVEIEPEDTHPEA
jgi:uncharacterized peroxidase-related enzyme